MNFKEDNYTGQLPALSDKPIEKFYQEVLEGLGSIPKRLQSKYFYDQQGDILFQQIMDCPQYYLSRCESEIFQNQAPKMAHFLQSAYDSFDLIELGAGDATKSQFLLQSLTEHQVDFTYMPIDISGYILSVLQDRLESQIPGLDLVPFEGEYFEMPAQATCFSSRPKVVMLLGANIGNMAPQDARLFCANIRKMLKPGDLAIIGFDLKKQPQVILDAYNDEGGITSRFNLNLLTRINKELHGNFNLNNFVHYQTYDPGNGACKSYLVSLCDHTVTIADHSIKFNRDETIFMEVSQKYQLPEIDELARYVHFEPIYRCQDLKGWFIDDFWQAI
ncbi:dimethylhistidine N-methyltransferase [Dyadobacter frigoris]|uniref:L-histidine N(alpha)-methyltransferase n=1 Tax=Dyadobacter frigoris TaxID=2576211 RepID=UPI0024A3B2FD|nr:L-histidine N(alpha)-methyltransferase [Dyadobacter frigoris]GLU55283.1 dimethylhistidine N-methyltransferase [Dyadobacter frigoris]